MRIWGQKRYGRPAGSAAAISITLFAFQTSQVFETCEVFLVFRREEEFLAGSLGRDWRNSYRLNLCAYK